MGRAPMTQKDLRAMCGWQLGDDGERIADLFGVLNKTVFDGALPVLPVTFPATLPYGRDIGQCHWCLGGANGEHRCIQIKSDVVGAMADVLLHEMLHAILSHTGRDPGHNSANWCSEVMRITWLVWGREVWAAPERVGKTHTDENGKRKSVRFQPKSPTGVKSIGRDTLSRWPHSLFLSVPWQEMLGGSSWVPPAAPEKADVVAAAKPVAKKKPSSPFAKFVRGYVDDAMNGWRDPSLRMAKPPRELSKVRESCRSTAIANRVPKDLTAQPGFDEAFNAIVSQMESEKLVEIVAESHGGKWVDMLQPAGWTG
jgi:hypothetical protein